MTEDRASSSQSGRRFKEPAGGSGMNEPPWLVVCPRCGGKALASDDLRCPACGLVREGRCALVSDGTVRQQLVERGPWRRDRTPRQHWPEPQSETYLLWLRRTCCGGNVLWAANEQHLQYLREYIGSELREGTHIPHQALHHKLPTWMKRAKHREEILAAIDHLAARL